MADNEKNRKSEEQKMFEEADNNGRFAGNDADASEAKNNAMKGGVRDTTGYDSSPSQNERSRTNPDHDGSDEAAHHGSAQADDFAGDSQNINADNSRPLEGDELEHARNKANVSKGPENSQ